MAQISKKIELLLIDNYDSFVYNLARYFEELNCNVRIFRNDEISIFEIEKLKPQAIVISPGPGKPSSAGVSLEVIHKFKEKVPILGVCLGHQAIVHAFGGKIVKAVKPMHGKLSKIKHDGKGLFKDLPSIVSVTRYHSLVADSESLPECLEVTSQAEDGTIMGVRHKMLKLEGVQFHPEAELTEYGHHVLKNFLKMI